MTHGKLTILSQAIHSRHWQQLTDPAMPLAETNRWTIAEK